MISMKSDLSVQAGLQMAQAAIVYAQENDWEITVAICDRSGHLIAFLRSENVILAAIDFAIDKAFTAATLRKSTADFGTRMASSPGLSLGVATRPRLMTWKGGLPIYAQGACVGGIGVSGALDHQDLACAQAALSSVGLTSEP